MSSDSLNDSRGSISTWITQLKDGDADAAQQLWQRYAVRLTEVARRQLGDAPRRIADEDDVAQSVFALVCRGAKSGRFQDLANRDDLWWLLLASTRRKAVDLMRREAAQKRGGGRVLPEAALRGGDDTGRQLTLDDLTGSNPTPQFLVMLDEQNQRLMALLRDDQLRSVAAARMEGYTVAEIADRLSLGLRAVERKLQLIRGKWRKELEP